MLRQFIYSRLARDEDGPGWAVFEVKKEIPVEVARKNLNRMHQLIAFAIPLKPPHNQLPALKPSSTAIFLSRSEIAFNRVETMEFNLKFEVWYAM